ncbi:hypothetical protein DFP73DRAFT_539524 [Morchella snyderi]|nr:hypothetical protein DFP73DRAFT_539524 [Morchella snyderi]
MRTSSLPRARKQAETVLLLCSPVFGDVISWVDGEDILGRIVSALHRSMCTCRYVFIHIIVKRECFTVYIHECVISYPHLHFAFILLSGGEGERRRSCSGNHAALSSVE